MLVQQAEESFGMGIEALSEGQKRKAMAMFEAAIELEKRSGVHQPQPRYLSYYGLCLGLEAKKLHEAVKFCREAATRENFNADIYYNLGRVLLKAGRRREGYESLRNGLRLHPSHKGIIRELRAIGVRRRPVLPFLSRDNPLNVALGRMRTQDIPRKSEPKCVEQRKGEGREVWVD
jgi:tetratricopeptide (TPR) repeat protein